MRIAIFSDVHGNLEALNAVLGEIEKEKTDRVFFLGDAVGYGPDPNACVQKIFEAADLVVAGNHDHGAVGRIEIELFNPFAREAILWTRSVLTAESREKICSMPMTAMWDGLFLVHASPERPGSWEYISSWIHAAHQFDLFEGKACLVGHTHRPAVFVHDGKKITASRESMLTFKEDNRYIVNVGSVGQPRDRNPDAGYALYDKDEKRLSLKRIQYNFRITQEKMRAAHLPSFLIDRLAVGD